MVAGLDYSQGRPTRLGNPYGVSKHLRSCAVNCPRHLGVIEEEVESRALRRLPPDAELHSDLSCHHTRVPGRIQDAQPVRALRITRGETLGGPRACEQGEQQHE
eukprot:650714-Hanusia_phi.AAC.1